MMADTSHVKSQGQSDKSGCSVWPGWFLMFLLSFALYAATAKRGAQWQDSGDFILRIITGQWVSSLGLALSHPLHQGLGRLAVAVIPLEPSLAITLISALGAALAVACTYGCVVTLTQRRTAAAFAAISLALANTFWHLATVTEVYTLTAALLAGECWCIVAYARHRGRGYLWGMLLLNGIGLANHLSALLTLPVLAVIVLNALRRKHITVKGVGIGVGLWLLGSSPYLVMVGQELIRSGDFGATMHGALFGQIGSAGASYAGQVFNVILTPRLFVISVAFVIYNFPNLLLPAAFYGMIAARRLDTPTLARRALLAGLMIHTVFVIRYNVIDRHTFFLPMYVLLAIFGGLGASAVRQWSKGPQRRFLVAGSLCLLLTTPAAYAIGTVVARHYQVFGPDARHKPYRDDYIYLLIPWSVVDRSAEQMSAQAVELAGKHGLIVVEDRMAIFAVRYKIWRTGLPELAAIDASQVERLQQAIVEDRPVVLVPRRVGEISVQTPVSAWKRHGDLYVLKAVSNSHSAKTGPP